MTSQATAAAELKQQGVIEAANDPNTSVTAEDAQRKIVQESNKAGVAAFTFNPDASPEEKAAAARADVPPGFHHQHKPKGLAVPTDLDDGTPSKYDLPSPTTAGAITPATPASPTSKARTAEEERKRWEERTGFAPRFGLPGSDEKDEGEGESLLDHQTWLEGKLSDKFFGDWYHNAAIIVFACLSSWTVAALGGGIAWVFIIMAACSTYYRTSIRRVRRNFRDDVNREMAKHRLETDTESLEWINSFLVKFWPIYMPVLAETIINSVDQVLSTSTPAFLDSLRLKTFTLGTKPPRMEHVKTYPKAEDDTVLMDWRFSFTPNDTADMTARQIKNKINPKVVLEIRVGKAMISKGLDVIVEDFAFSGLMRVKIKLQIPFPHIEKVEICFLDRPEIDYVCKPIGGDMLGFDINFIPGLESFILEQIHANIGPIMYAPNVFPIEVAKLLSGDAVDQAIGVVAITIHAGHGLKNPDKFSGTPDPYVVVSLNNREPLAQTKIVKENANPRWGETKYVILTSLTETLTFPVFDFNEFRKDKELGAASFPLERFNDAFEHENEQLVVMSNGKERGQLVADLKYFPVLEGRTLEDGKKEPAPESNTGIAKFTVEQAKDLDGTKSLIGQLNPYAVLLLNGKEIHISQKLKRTNNPIWSNGSKEILITDRKKAKLGVVIKDDRDIAADPILGTYQIGLDDMIKMMDKGQEWFQLAGAKSGRAKMTLQWKPVGLTGVGAGSGGYITPIGVMRFHFKNARNLKNLEAMGKSDPYVRVLLSGVEKARTVTFQNNLNPDFDEVLYVPVHTTREKLVIEVMDQETMGKDRTLGEVSLMASDYVSQDENGEYKVHDTKTELSDNLRMHGKGQPKGVLNYNVAFYPCLNIADPEDEEEKGKSSLDATRPSVDSVRSNGSAMPNGKALTGEEKEMAKLLSQGEKEQTETAEEKKAQKIRLSPEELLKYESGLIIFKLLDADLTHNNVRVEVLVDDYVFPNFVSSKARSKKFKFDEIGDCFVRELEFSRLTLRISEKQDNKGEEKNEHVIAKLTGNTLDTLKQCLNNPTTLKLKDEDGRVSSIKVSLKYIPVKMQLDPSESINNMGKLRVDVLDATDLPSADRNGYSDPYCKFELNGQSVFKTKVQKKTLHPAWNEFFEVNVPSRTAADFRLKVFDWDFGDKADLLGCADVNLNILDPFIPKEVKLGLDGKSGTIRLRLLFKPDYVVRSRQGSSTFSGTFAAPGKVVVGVAGAPIKGVGAVGHGVGKGIGFIGRGFKGKKKDGEDVNGSFSVEDEDAAASGSNVPVMGSVEEPPSSPPNHARTKSFGQASTYSTSGLAPGGGPLGTATFTIVSANGYPASSNVMVLVKQLGSKGSKTVHKTKHLKSSTGTVKLDESFKVSCSPETQFQLQVKHHAFIGSDDDLGEAMLVVDESGTNAEKTIKAGNGSVVVKSTFTPGGRPASPNGNMLGGPPPAVESPRNSLRRSFMSKRESGRASREVTPSPGQ